MIDERRTSAARSMSLLCALVLDRLRNPSSPVHTGYITAQWCTMPIGVDAPVPFAATVFTEVHLPGVIDLLSQHFSYLNLYHPFVIAYPTVMVTVDNFTSSSSASYSQPFAEFVKAQHNPRCRPSVSETGSLPSSSVVR
jgi:hypothetical protein